MDRSSRANASLPLPWTDLQRQRALRITQKLLDSAISVFFRTAVDPVRDNAPGYLDKVKRPMDLGTVFQNLKDDKYPTLERWKEDIGQIWKNATLYNGEDSLMDLLARELNDTFKRYCDAIPRSEFDLWQTRLRRSQARLEKAVRARPVLIEAPAPPAAPPKGVKFRLKTGK
jgi:hypothetical protein